MTPADPAKAVRHFAARGWILAALFAVLLVARALSDAPLRPEWLVYVGAAVLLRLWAGAHLGDHGNGARAEAPRLARGGPYRLSRNPLYVANILAAAGLVLFANALPLAASFALIGLVVLHHVLLVRHEETVLAAHLGEAYARYRAGTPRWYGLPRPRDRDVEDGGKEGRVSLKTLLRRQGRNVLHPVAAAALLALAARLS